MKVLEHEAGLIKVSKVAYGGVVCYEGEYFIVTQGYDNPTLLVNLRNGSCIRVDLNTLVKLVNG